MPLEMSWLKLEFQLLLWRVNCPHFVIFCEKVECWDLWWKSWLGWKTFSLNLFTLNFILCNIFPTRFLIPLNLPICMNWSSFSRFSLMYLLLVCCHRCSTVKSLIAVCYFWYVSPCVWIQFPASFHHPHSNWPLLIHLLASLHFFHHQSLLQYFIPDLKYTITQVLRSWLLVPLHSLVASHRLLGCLLGVCKLVIHLLINFCLVFFGRLATC